MSAEKLGFDPDRLDRARQVLEAHVAMRTTPGGVGLVVRRGGVAAGCGPPRPPRSTSQERESE